MEKPDQKFDVSEYIKSLNTREGVLRETLEAQKLLESGLGIKLTNIELVGLRRIAEEVIPLVYKQQTIEKTDVDSLSIVDHHREIPARFLMEFYNIDAYDIEKIFKEYGGEISKEYFRRKQAEKHMP